MNPIESKAVLTREAGHWVLNLELQPWLALDLLLELEGRVFVDITSTVNPNGVTPIKFVQMPLLDTDLDCPNCGAAVHTVKARSTSRSTSERLWHFITQT